MSGYVGVGVEVWVWRYGCVRGYRCWCVREYVGVSGCGCGGVSGYGCGGVGVCRYGCGSVGVRGCVCGGVCV